jgi:hypothetical protein
LRRVAEDPDKAEALRRFEESLELVEKLARQVGKVVGSAVELDDLLSFGREGLLDASRRFDVTRGVPFRAYASYRVRGAIYDGVRQMSRLPRRAHERLNGLAAAAGVSEGALEDVSAGPVPGADKAAADAALAEHLASLATAMAMTARWRMPPENSCGYWLTRRSGCGIATRWSSSTARAMACLRVTR